MNRKIRFAYLTFAIIFIFSLFTIKVFADEEVGEDTPTAAPVETQAPPVETNPPETAAPATKKPTAPTTKATKATQATKATKATSSKSDSNSSYNSNSNSNSYYQSRTYSTTRATVNNNSAYISRSQSVASTRAATSAVYEANEKVDNKDTLKNKDWKSITAQLKSATNNDSDDSADSFDVIKNNTASGDNGIWMLFAGVGLIAVGVIIIIVLIVLAIRRRKRMKSGAGRRGYSEDDDDDRPSAPRGGSRGRAAQPAPQRTQPRDNSRRQVRKRSKFDTDEVYVPKNPPRSGGRRYKPRH